VSPEIHRLIGWMTHAEHALTECAVRVTIPLQNEHLLEMLRHFFNMVVSGLLGYTFLHVLGILGKGQQDRKLTG